tara:strand:+ start:889 stop:1215 length:327 start_codon:yes stop_codon:yes gene_type:complete
MKTNKQMEKLKEKQIRMLEEMKTMERRVNIMNALSKCEDVGHVFDKDFVVHTFFQFSKVRMCCMHCPCFVSIVAGNPTSVTSLSPVFLEDENRDIIQLDTYLMESEEE